MARGTRVITSAYRCSLDQGFPGARRASSLKLRTEKSFFAVRLTLFSAANCFGAGLALRKDRDKAVRLLQNFVIRPVRLGRTLERADGNQVRVSNRANISRVQGHKSLGAARGGDELDFETIR